MHLSKSLLPLPSPLFLNWTMDQDIILIWHYVCYALIKHSSNTRPIYHPLIQDINRCILHMYSVYNTNRTHTQTLYEHMYSVYNTNRTHTQLWMSIFTVCIIPIEPIPKLCMNICTVCIIPIEPIPNFEWAYVQCV